MKNVADVFCGIFLLIICGIGFWSLQTLPDASGIDYIGPAGLPKLSLIILILCSVILIVKGVIQNAPKKYLPEKKVFIKICLIFFIFYLYLALVTYLGDYFLSIENVIFEYGGGFCISTVLFLLTILPLLGRKNIIEILSVTIITTGLLFVIFGMFFNVLLP